MREQHQVGERVDAEVVARLAPVEGKQRLGAVEAGGGDHQVDVRMLGDQLRGGRVHGLQVGEVELERGHLHPIPQLGRQPRQAVRVAVEEHERGFVLGQQPAELRPQPARGAGDERLREAPLGSQARRGAPGEGSQPRGRPGAKPHLALVPGLDVEQLDAEALIVVDVDDRPGPEPQRRPVGAQSRLQATLVGRLELRAPAKPEGDVQQALVRDPVARRPRLSLRLGVVDQLDEHVVRPQEERLAASPPPGPTAPRARARAARDRRPPRAPASRRRTAASAPGPGPRGSPSAPRRPARGADARGARERAGRPPSARPAPRRGPAGRRAEPPARRADRSAAACRLATARSSAASRSATQNETVV